MSFLTQQIFEAHRSPVSLRVTRAGASGRRLQVLMWDDESGSMLSYNLTEDEVAALAKFLAVTVLLTEQDHSKKGKIDGPE